MTPASHHDSRYLPYCIVYSHHTDDPIDKVFVDNKWVISDLISKGYVHKETELVGFPSNSAMNKFKEKVFNRQSKEGNSINFNHFNQSSSI